MQLSSLRLRNYLRYFLIVPIAVSIYTIQINIDIHKGIEQRVEEFIRLPNGEYLKPLTLGYEQLVSDIIWLSAIQVIGDKVVTSMGYDWVYHALDVVTTLDPKFSYAYQLGGITLSTLGKRPDLSNKLLEKGVKENPDVWQIPFYIGFNNFFYLANFEAAAEYMEKASKLPGHPAYLPQLAARLYVQAGNPNVALEFLSRMYKETEDEKVKLALEQRIKEVIVERDARFLENAVMRYKDLYKVYPDDLTNLVKVGIIQNIPQEPFGGYYYLNHNDGRIYSSVIKARMKVYGKG